MTRYDASDFGTLTLGQYNRLRNPPEPEPRPQQLPRPWHERLAYHLAPCLEHALEWNNRDLPTIRRHVHLCRTECPLLADCHQRRVDTGDLPRHGAMVEAGRPPWVWDSWKLRQQPDAFWYQHRNRNPKEASR